MKQLLSHTEAVIRFVRLPNLLMVAGIALLLRWFLLLPFLYLNHDELISPVTDYLLLVCATVFLAAGGYIINDYFDIRIDAINRPHKQVVTRLLKPVVTLRIYWAVNIIALLLGGYLAFRIHSLWFGLLFPAGAYLFWIYSLRWKQLLVVKNLVVAIVSASLILLVLLYEFFYMRLYAPEYFAGHIPQLRSVFYLILTYAGFAFLTTLFREVIKDMEDLPGDQACGTRSIPAVYGIRASKWIAGVMVVIMMALLAWIQCIVYRFDLELLNLYLILTVQLPALYLIITIIRAQNPTGYSFAASLAKLIMVMGVLSLLFL